MIAAIITTKILNSDHWIVIINNNIYKIPGFKKKKSSVLSNLKVTPSAVQLVKMSVEESRMKKRIP